ncbi:MAG: beta-galactosidase trimerization domain-containing protein [Candidatus Omnitrophota bacterium]
MKEGIGKESNWIPSMRARFTQFNRDHFGPDYAKKEVALTKQYGFNTLGFWVEMDGWLLYPSKYAPLEETIGQTDLFGELAQECEKEQIRLIACWMGVHCQTYHLRQHPDWLCRHYSSHFENNPFPDGSEGEQNYGLCLNSPFREVLLGEVDEVLRRYKVAGVYFDGVYRIAGYCYCRYCQEKFLQRYNRPIPADFNDPDWWQFVNDYTTDFSRDAKELIGRVSPDVKLFQDCHGTLIGTYDSQENIRGCSKYVDSFILESYHECSGEAPTFVAMESQLVKAESRRPVSHARWVTYGPGSVHTAIPESSALIWAYDVVATGGLPLECDQEGFWYDRTLEKPLGDFMTRLAGLNDILVGSEPLKYVALLHSLACKYQRMPLDNRSGRAYFEGFYLSLEQSHIPFDIITEEDILDGCLNRYAALVLPNIEFMTDEVSQKVEEFSDAGGGVVATYRTSFCTGNGEGRQRPALSDLLGIAEVNGFFIRGVKMATVKYDAVSLTEPSNLFEIITDHPITKGLLPKTLYNFAGAVVDIKPSDRSVVLARLRNYNQKLANSGKFFRWLPAEWAQEFIFAREGTGKVVYFSAGLDRAFWEFGYNAAGLLLSQAVKWAASRDAGIEIEASPLIAARVRQHPKRDVISIHLTNYAVNQIFMPGFPGSFLANPQNLGRSHKVQHISPESNIKIKMALPKAGLSRCYTFTGQPLSCKKKGFHLEITVPIVKEGEIIFVEFRLT